MKLEQRVTPGASITGRESGWQLQIPSGASSHYRLAQLDDYLARRRRDFPWSPPALLTLRARVSSHSIPGTWGFGLWNDPFSAFIGLGGMKRPLPVLPNAAWFFHGSPENYLSFRNDKPGQGFLAATFHSAVIPSIFVAPGLFLAPLLAIRPWARWMRARLSRMISEDSLPIEVDATQWHDYRLHWELDRAGFEVDGIPVFSTPVSPAGPLGLVIWVDNQYAAFMPSGEIKAGALANPDPAWLEISNVTLQSLS